MLREDEHDRYLETKCERLVTVSIVISCASFPISCWMAVCPRPWCFFIYAYRGKCGHVEIIMFSATRTSATFHIGGWTLAPFKNFETGLSPRNILDPFYFH